MADALELRVDVGRRRDVAVGKMAEVEFHPALKTPFERHLVDRPGALALVHGRMIVPGRVEMGAVVRRELHALDGPSLPVRQILLLEPGKERQDLRQTLLVVGIFDLGAKPRRVGWDVVLQRRGNVDQSPGHRFSPKSSKKSAVPELSARAMLLAGFAGLEFAARPAAGNALAP